MKDCLFCKIVAKEIAANLVFESDKVIVFEDIYPKADTHLLIVPKKHIATFLDLENNHLEIVNAMIKAAQKIVKEKNLTKDAYRLIFNGGAAQHVPHLHWHLLAGQLIAVPE